MRVFATIAAILALGYPACAQSRPDSRAETRGDEGPLGPLMAKVMAGGGDVENLRQLVEALLAGKDRIAAPWWIAQFEEIESHEKLSGADREALAKLRRACERHEGFEDDRKLILKIIRETERSAANKEIDAARHSAAIAEAMLGLVPDPTLSKLLEPVTKRLPQPKPDEPAAKRTPWPAALEDLAVNGCGALVAAGLDAYDRAGCRPGRLALAHAIRAFGPLSGDANEKRALARLRERSRTIEPASALSIFVRTVGHARFFRDGEPLAVTEGGAAFDAQTAAPLVIAALPGDAVTIAFDEPYSFDAVGNSFVVALNARTESRDLGAKEIFCDVSEKPGRPGATLYPLPIAKKKPNPPKSLFGRSPEQDDDLKRFNTYFELPKVLKRSVDVPCLADMVGFALEFDAKKLAPLWIGTEADHFAITIKVPGGR
jgi:hypothetical protein